MKLYNRILSTLLAVILMFGALSCLAVIGVGAEEAKEEDDTNYDDKVSNQYLNTVYKTPEEKLATMTLVSHIKNEKTKLYIDPVSGEVATQDVATGKILFSNPYDVASSKGSASTKKQILSQIVVNYIDNGTPKQLHSFEEAAMRDQITVLNIKNGVRVEYTIGREESRKLVPRWILAENYLKYIDGPLKAAMEAGEISAFFYNKFSAFYDLQSLEAEKSQKAKEQLVLTYPICEFEDIYTFAADASSVELNWVESYIKSYCEDYTFEMMDADHDATGYVAEDEQFPVFKMALEYSLDANGALLVRLPCNGLRYDMATYTLENITILPYMGAGNSINADGEYANYNFYPDGSGSLFDFEQLNTNSTTTVRGKVYGLDYAYHTLPVVSYQKAIRYPVYGTVASEKFYTFSYTIPEYTDAGVESGKILTVTETVSNTIVTEDKIEEYITKKDAKAALIKGTLTESSYQRGYVAVIESGESLAEIATYHAGALSDYNTMMNYFNPKPKDSYDISDSISVTTSSTWTVVSDRKYSGNISIRYQMLTDEVAGKATQEAAKAEGKSYSYYDTSWLGMAEAYRDYLVGNGTISKIEKPEESIPLYLEVFGALETQQQIATIPVDVMTPLTTFEDIMTMYTDLSQNKVGNINFKLTGFANGGMYYTVPAKLKWERAVGGASGFENLISELKQKTEEDGTHAELFPDFDFAYMQENTLFDGLSLKNDAIKTIDNRYSSFRQYSATQQSYVSFFQLAIAPSRYNKFYEKLIKNYSKYDIQTMSVASLGTALNSDFDEDEPYNREDSKNHTVEAFKDLAGAGYSLMTEGANAYTWGYVDHIINVDLDSSRYIKSSASVPFIGAVLHGYVQFAGTPFNEEGDTDYAILRAIENGAGMYFILSYQNTQELKEDEFLSQYYSVRYDIWKDDVIKYYNKLNSLLSDVQDKVIVNHQFLTGERVLDLDELQAELEEQLKQAEEDEKNKQDAIEMNKVIVVADAWKTAEGAALAIEKMIANMQTINKNELEKNYESLKASVENFAMLISDTKDMIEFDPDGMEGSVAKPAVEALRLEVTRIKNFAVDVLKGYARLEKENKAIEELLAEIDGADEIIQNADTLSEDVKTAMLAKLKDFVQAAKDASAGAAPELEKHPDYISETDAAGVYALALQIMPLLEAEEALFEACTDEIFTAEDIKNESVLADEDKEDDSQDTETAEVNKYLVDNNQIVVVTYGDRDDKTFEKTEYKSFILNYNNFAVKVVYENKSYTIPSGGYIVLYD